MKKLLITSLACICILMSIQANAQTYILFDGIDGESNFAPFKNSTQVSSFSWGAKNTVSLSPTTGMTGGKSSFEEFSFTKNRGTASAAIQTLLYSGRRIPKAEIRYYTAGNTTPSLTIILEDVFITSWNLAGSDNEKPVETFTITAVKYKTEEFVRNPDGTSKRITTGWDVSKNSPITW